MDAADQIRQLADRLIAAGAKGDVQGILDIMSDDVVFLPPNDTPKVGKDEYHRWMAPFQAKYSIIESLQSREIRVSGDIAYEWGLFQETFTPKTATSDTPPIALDGKFLRIYQRQPDGNWKLARACWNNNHA